MAIQWRRIDKDIWGSETARVWSDYSQRTHPVQFRIDGRRKTREGYRVDKGGLMGWEAIDGGQGPRTVREAKAIAESYLAAMHEQKTLDPHHARQNLGVRDMRRRPRRDSDSLARDYALAVHSVLRNRYGFSRAEADGAIKRWSQLLRTSWAKDRNLDTVAREIKRYEEGEG